MKNPIIPILLLTCACNYMPPDPCAEGSPLGAQLSAEQLSEICESGETGYDEHELLCSVGHQGAEFSGCAIASTIAGGGPINSGEYLATVEGCASTSAPFPHVPSWATPVTPTYAGQLDMWCGTEDYYGPNYGDAATGAKWSLCRNEDPGAWQPYYPATVGITTPGANWPGSATDCTQYQDSIVGSCTKELVAIGGASGLPTALHVDTWTCTCDDDDDCQPGAVCEAGYYLDGISPRPSLCTWTDGSGDSVAPVGPVAYGLDEWRDGVTVSGDDIVMTPMFFIGLTQGVINDAHSFGLAGELTECGAESLCAHIGLGVGDIVQAEQRHSDELETGETVAIDVVSPDGSVRILQVSVSPF